MGVLGIGLNTSGGVGDFLKNPFTKDVNNSLRGSDFDAFEILEFVSGNVLAAIQNPGQAANAPEGLSPGTMIRLVGNQMPKVPFVYGGEQKEVKEFYPGNPEAALQVLGPRESDIPIKGRFYSKRYRGPVSENIPGAGIINQAAGDSLYALPMALVDELDAMRRRGNLVMIRLGEWARYGIIKEVEWQVRKLGDIDYMITFSVVSIDPPSRCPVIEGDKSLPLSKKSELSALNEALAADAAARQIPSSVPTSLSGLLTDLTSTIAGAVSGVLSFIDNIIQTGEDLTGNINRAVGVIKNAEAEVSRARLRLGRISYSLSFAGIPVPERYSASKIISTRISQSNDISNFLAQIRRQFQALALTVPLARHRVVANDTLQKIAVKFYSNANEWKKIYEHNKLTSTALTRGTVLEIPRL